jgi:hypothetical protein
MEGSATGYAQLASQLVVAAFEGLLAAVAVDYAADAELAGRTDSCKWKEQLSTDCAPKTIISGMAVNNQGCLAAVESCNQ